MPFVVASDGVRLYAEAHGEGPPILLSCALNTTHENWRPQVEPLVAAGYRLLLWDYRGHGLSDAPEDPAAYSMERVVQDLGQVLEALAPGARVVLGGLSFGGLVSLHFALRQPDRVRALLLVDTGPGFKNPEAQRRWEESVERTASYLERKGLEAFVASQRRDLFLVPVAITYERLVEEGSMIEELEGGEKTPESVLEAARRDFWLDAGQALEYGLVHKVVKKRDELPE